MIELEGRPSWQAYAACQGVGSAMFFPKLGEGRGAPGTTTTMPRSVKALCAGCPVRAECLEFGLDEHHGFWAGTSSRQRQRMRKEGVQ